MKITVIIPLVPAGVAHPVERHLAKVEVASSSLVTRSIKKEDHTLCGLLFCYVVTTARKSVPTVRCTVGGDGLTESKNANVPRHLPCQKRKGKTNLQVLRQK